MASSLDAKSPDSSPLVLPTATLASGVLPTGPRAADCALVPFGATRVALLVWSKQAPFDAHVAIVDTNTDAATEMTNVTVDSSAWTQLAEGNEQATNLTVEDTSNAWGGAWTPDGQLLILYGLAARQGGSGNDVVACVWIVASDEGVGGGVERSELRPKARRRVARIDCELLTGDASRPSATSPRSVCGAFVLENRCVLVTSDAWLFEVKIHNAASSPREETAATVATILPVVRLPMHNLAVASMAYEPNRAILAVGGCVKGRESTSGPGGPLSVWHVVSDGAQIELVRIGISGTTTSNDQGVSHQNASTSSTPTIDSNTAKVSESDVAEATEATIVDHQTTVSDCGTEHKDQQCCSSTAQVEVLPRDHVPSETRRIDHVAFSPDGSSFSTVDRDGCCTFYRVVSSDELPQIQRVRTNNTRPLARVRNTMWLTPTSLVSFALDGNQNGHIFVLDDVPTSGGVDVAASIRDFTLTSAECAIGGASRVECTMTRHYACRTGTEGTRESPTQQLGLFSCAVTRSDTVSYFRMSTSRASISDCVLGLQPFQLIGRDYPEQRMVESDLANQQLHPPRPTSNSSSNEMISSAVKSDEDAVSTPLSAQKEHWQCRYRGKPCPNPRSLKKNGVYHRLCEYHRCRSCECQRHYQRRRPRAQADIVGWIDNLLNGPFLHSNMTDEEAQDILSSLFDETFEGFLSSATSGTLSIWNDQSLLDVRLSPDHIMATDALYKTRGTVEVWRGQYQSRIVAIKRFHPEQEDQAGATSFAHNVKAVATLTHPNIVSLIGMEWDRAPQLQVVTEYVEGGDLRTLLDSPLASDLTWTEFKCQVAIDIAAALDYLHTLALRVPLRCLTSRKVLLDTNGRAKVNLLQTSGIENDHKLRWTAPEVILGGATTDRSDIYSFGVLLCELDTTHVPFHAVVNPNGSTMEDQQVAMLVASGKMVPSVSSTCPEGIARLASQCVSYDPSQRPVASAVTYRLREILKNEL